MRLPSLVYVLDESRRTIWRFPFPLVSAMVGCGIACTIVGNTEVVGDTWFILLLTISLGVPLFFALTLMKERPPFPVLANSIYIYPAGLLLLCLFFWMLFVNRDINYSLRYLQWATAVVFSGFFTSYLGGREINGFWQFNKRLFIWLFISSFYTIVLFGGIAIALLAVNELLDVQINHKVYQYLIIFAGYIFEPWLFLFGVPQDYVALDGDTTYPKGLKNFTQYILVPLAALYFLILYVYMGKILVTHQWPQGWVSWLTLTASILGLITFLLLYPVRDRRDSRWVKNYSKVFCIAAVPLLFMLFIAAFKRTSQYGLTERRYFLIALGLWLLVVFLYFIFRKKPNIKWVPISFVVFVILTSFGPWGAYSFSLSSQMGRLKGIMERNGILEKEKVRKLDREIPVEERTRLSASLDYIIEYHGIKHLQEFFKSDLNSFKGKMDLKNRSYRDVTKWVMAEMGQTYVGKWEQPDIKRIHFDAEPTPLDIRGYDSAARFQTYSVLPPKGMLGERIQIYLDIESQIMHVYRGSTLLINVPMQPLFDSLATDHRSQERTTLPQKLMITEVENPQVKAKIYFQSLDGNCNSEGKIIKFVKAEGVLIFIEKP